MPKYGARHLPSIHRRTLRCPERPRGRVSFKGSVNWIVRATHISSNGRSHAYRSSCWARVATTRLSAAWYALWERTRHHDKIVTQRASTTRLVKFGANVSASSSVKPRNPRASPRRMGTGSHGAVKKCSASEVINTPGYSGRFSQRNEDIPYLPLAGIGPFRSSILPHRVPLLAEQFR